MKKLLIRILELTLTALKKNQYNPVIQEEFTSDMIQKAVTTLMRNKNKIEDYKQARYKYPKYLILKEKDKSYFFEVKSIK